MEYLEGRDLHHIIAAHEPLSILTMQHHVAGRGGLYCATRAMSWHRDIKPANIMVLRDRHRGRSMDFGIARLTQAPDATRLTSRISDRHLRYMAQNSSPEPILTRYATFSLIRRDFFSEL